MRGHPIGAVLSHGAVKRSHLTRTAVRPAAVKFQMRWAIAAETRMQPWDWARFVPRM